jgi:predicted RNase H-like nuclease (RuvC/YqgF family)
MISMQQLEELESRVVKALQLIGDLRTENSKLENENEELKSEMEEARLSLEAKEQEVEKIRRELDQATRELEELNAKEEVLEKKVIALLGKLDTLSPGGGIPAGEKIERKSFESARPSSFRSTPSRPKKTFVEDEDTIILDEPADDYKEEEIRVETVKKTEKVDLQDDDDIIIIDDEGDLTSKGKDGIALETISENDDDIILLDEEDEEIVIDDVDKDSIIIDEEEKAPRAKGKAKELDDDFLIIEEDEK